MQNAWPSFPRRAGGDRRPLHPVTQRPRRRAAPEEPLRRVPRRARRRSLHRTPRARRHGTRTARASSSAGTRLQGDPEGPRGQLVSHLSLVPSLASKFKNRENPGRPHSGGHHLTSSGPSIGFDAVAVAGSTRMPRHHLGDQRHFTTRGWSVRVPRAPRTLGQGPPRQTTSSPTGWLTPCRHTLLTSPRRGLPSDGRERRRRPRDHGLSSAYSSRAIRGRRLLG